MIYHRLARLSALFVAVFVLAIAPAAFADGYVTSQTSSSVNTSGYLVVTVAYSGAGCGSAGNPCYFSLTASVRAFYGCFNGGGNFPKAQNKNAATGTVSALSSPVFDQGGQVSATITTTNIPPAPASIHCGTGQEKVLVRVEYTNIVVTLTTGPHAGATTTAPNASANGPFSP